MAEAVMLSAIESLECWLLKKGGIQEENVEKLYSLIVGMSDLEEENKEVVHTLLLEFGMEGNRHERESNMKKLYDLSDLNKEKIYSLVVGMSDFLEDYKGKLYHLLFRVGKRVDTLDNITGQWGDNERVFNKERLSSLLVEITDLWGDDKGELDKEKLHSLLFQMLNNDNHLKKKMVCRMSGEVAALWKDKQPKLNKEKLYTWLTHKVDLSDIEYIFFVLLDVALLYDSSDFNKENREAVEGAKREFRMILDLITDKKLGDESSIRYFISDAVDIAHDAHSLIQLKDSDPFALLFELSVFLQARNYLEAYPEWFSKKFKYTVRGLEEIKDGMLGFGVERLQDVREMEGSENVVGLEENVKLLLSDERNGELTVIAGTAGIGKTTLARQLYNHTTIHQQFERRAWVCLSRMFSRKEMLVSLIRQVVDCNELASLEKIERADYKSLKQVLRQQLMGMRHFIVLDDMWGNTTHYKYVMKALAKGILKENVGWTMRHFLFRDDVWGNTTRYKYLMHDLAKGILKDKGSRLLVTTRTAFGDDNGANFHKMKYMDDEKSWTLLLKTLHIEGSDEQFPKPLVKKARHILRQKCGGLPLAIKEVGRNWAKERQSGSEWEKLIESIDLSETLSVLESSYHNWDRQVQSCFLPLAFFKEGETIRAKRLVHIWIIMGVVSKIEKEYQSCLEELHRESIIDAIDRDKIANIRKCCIHVVFHMLSIRKAEDELNFEILGKNGNNQPCHQPHHRAIYCSREKLMNYSSNQDKHLVSLFLYGGGHFNASPCYWKHFEQLKILDMEDFGLKILPDVIGTLSELRYLGLRNNYIQELPHSLSRLKKLEVLDIALNFMVEVEDIIWDMESLCHLYMSDISCRKPLMIDTLKNLKTLTYVSVHNWTYEASRLKMMTSLTKLGIQEVDGKTNLRELFLSLIELTNLEFVILRGYRFKSMPSLDAIWVLPYLSELKLDGLITRLPTNSFPPRMTRLSLVNSCLREDPMPILENLSHLTHLKLQNAYTGQQMVISHNGFFYLEFLVIEELWHLTNLQIEKGAMKRLKDLEINNCPYLDTLAEDYFPRDDMVFKMKTTKKNATKIRESSFVSGIKKVDIQP